MVNYVGEDIYKILPIRYPYMILDELLVENGESAVSYIFLSGEEWYLKCHFYNYPIMPGYLLQEAMGQTLLSTFISKIVNKDSQIPLMAKVEELTFSDYCIPGDNIIIKSYLERFKYGMAIGRSYAYKNDVQIAGVKLTYILKKKKEYEN